MSSQLALTLTGSTTVKQTSRTIAWDNDQQSELVYRLSSTDGEKTLDFSNIDNIKLIYISSEDGDFKVKSTVGAMIIEEETSLYVLAPTADYISSLTSLILSTDSTTDIDIEVNIYGEAS